MGLQPVDNPDYLGFEDLGAVIRESVFGIGDSVTLKNTPKRPIAAGFYLPQSTIEKYFFCHYI